MKKKVIAGVAIGIVVVFILGIVGLTSLVKIMRYGRMLRVPSASSKYIGRQYDDVDYELSHAGFKYVFDDPIYDLLDDSDPTYEEVVKVTIDGDSDFKKHARYRSKKIIYITYHTVVKPLKPDPTPEPEPSEEIDIPEETTPTESELLTQPSTAPSTQPITTTTQPSTEPPTQPSTEPPSTIPITKPEDDILTIENNADLKELLSTNFDYDLFEAFGIKYKGMTIKFDGCVVYAITNATHRTKFDFLLEGGDYVNVDTVNPGPEFRFSDIYVSQLGVSGSSLPAFMKEGNNVIITAMVIGFSQNTGIFDLIPILVEPR